MLLDIDPLLSIIKKLHMHLRVDLHCVQPNDLIGIHDFFTAGNKPNAYRLYIIYI